MIRLAGRGRGHGSTGCCQRTESHAAIKTHDLGLARVLPIGRSRPWLVDHDLPVTRRGIQRERTVFISPIVGKAASVHGPAVDLGILHPGAIGVHHCAGDGLGGLAQGDIAKILLRIVRAINRETVEGKRLNAVVMRRQMKLHCVNRLRDCHAEVTVVVGHPIVLIAGGPIIEAVLVAVLKYPEVHMAGRAAIRLQDATINIGRLKGDVLVCKGSPVSISGPVVA